jgi:hypothetical protein
MPRVWNFDDKEWCELGAKRWVAEWYVLEAWAEAKVAANPDYEWDPHKDIRTVRTVHVTRAAALRSARRGAGESMFGVAEVKHQVVDWYVEEDRIGEWVDAGQAEEVCA